MNNQSAKEIIKKYDLKPLEIEGGYFKEIYRSSALLNTEAGVRSSYTHIYYLLKKGQISKLHKLKSDEIWHFYGGYPITIINISPEGNLTKEVLGPDLTSHKQEFLFPKGHCFGAYLNDESDFCFLGCTVIPGFEYQDFELGKREDLLEKYPKFRKYILKLT